MFRNVRVTGTGYSPAAVSPSTTSENSTLAFSCGGIRAMWPTLPAPTVANGFGPSSPPRRISTCSAAPVEMLESFTVRRHESPGAGMAGSVVSSSTSRVGWFQPGSPNDRRTGSSPVYLASVSSSSSWHVVLEMDHRLHPPAGIGVIQQHVQGGRLPICRGRCRCTRTGSCRFRSRRRRCPERSRPRGWR